jgi:cysteinyl-tRNA synthetase
MATPHEPIDMQEELKKLHGSYRSSSSETEESEEILIDEDKVRTVIEEDFDTTAVPNKIFNPMKERKRNDKLTTNLAKMGSLITTVTVIIGIVSIIISFMRG